MSVTNIETFKKVVGSFATGVAVATTMHEDKPVGMTINSFTSVSLDPLLILFCIDHKANCLQLFKKHPNFSINLLTAKQQNISNLFAFKTEDQWSDVSWEATEFNTPFLTESLAALHCSVEQIIEAGDHSIFIGRVVGMDLDASQNNQDPLLYFKGQYASLK